MKNYNRDGEKGSNYRISNKKEKWSEEKKRRKGRIKYGIKGI